VFEASARTELRSTCSLRMRPYQVKFYSKTTTHCNHGARLIVQSIFLGKYTHIHNHYTALWTMSGITRVSWYQKVYFANFWIFWCKMKITQARAPTTWMDCQPIQTNWCPISAILTIFYARCPSWHNPLNLSWLGTGTKYAGLHTR